MAKEIGLMTAAVGQMTMTARPDGESQRDSIAEPSSITTVSEDIFHPDSICSGPDQSSRALNTEL